MIVVHTTMATTPMIMLLLDFLMRQLLQYGHEELLQRSSGRLGPNIEVGS